MFKLIIIITMSLFSNHLDNRKFGEIANQSNVVIQTKHDEKDLFNRPRLDKKEYFVYPAAPAPTMENATVRIDTGDLVFRVGKSRYQPSSLMNNAVSVTSNMNGFGVQKNKVTTNFVDPDSPTEEEVLQALSESIVFVGQALSYSSPLPDNTIMKKLQLTTRIHGTGTIVNTGGANLCPGDMLYWDLFKMEEVTSEEYKKRLRRAGVSEKKVPLKTVPMNQAMGNFRGAAYTAILNNKKGASGHSMASRHFATKVRGAIDAIIALTTEATLKTNARVDSVDGLLKLLPQSKKKSFVSAVIDEMMDGFVYLQEDLKRREVGKVLSFAGPGKPVDVLIGSK